MRACYGDATERAMGTAEAAAANGAREWPGSMIAVVDAMYSIEGDRLVPSELVQGPWDPTTCHGGPVAAVLARAIEHVETPHPMRVARLTIDLLRPVPIEPVEIRTDVVRAGRQIHVVDATMWHGPRLVSRASGVLVRCDRDIEVDADKNERAVGPPPPDRHHESRSEFELIDSGDFTPPGFVNAIELRRVAGSLNAGVPAVGWARLTKPLVVGEELTPLQRLACIGDFSSGIANYVDFFVYTTPNADLSYHLVRHPIGEWIGIDAATVMSPDGVGQSRARLFDETGFLGQADATMVVAPREAPLR